jgi:hypothetical protein
MISLGQKDESASLRMAAGENHERVRAFEMSRTPPEAEKDFFI